MHTYLESMTESQRAATCHLNGPAMVIAGPGSGKCVTANTLIPTDKGLIYIDKIPCHFDVTHKGKCTAIVAAATENGIRPSPTSHWFDMGEAPTVALKTESGLILQGTYEHPLRVVLKNGDVTWKRLEEIREGDIVTVSLGTNIWGHQALDPLTAYVLGLLIGDGALSHKGGTFGLCRNDTLMENAFRLFLKNEYGYDNVKSYYKKNTRSVTHTAHSVEIKKDLERRYGVPMVKSPLKYIPDTVLQSNKGTILQFLRGLFDTDASVDGVTFEYSTASERLGHEVQLVLLNLGIRAVRNQKTVDAYPDRVYQRIQVTGEALKKLGAYGPFLLHTRKAEKLKKATSKKGSPNKDLVLNQQARLRRLRDKHFKGQPFWHGNSSSLLESQEQNGKPKKFGIKRYISGSRNPSKESIRRILAFAPEDDPDAKFLKQCSNEYMMEPVVEVKVGKQQRVFDFTVPNGASFVGNGLVNHNTRVITYRIVHLIQEHQVHPSSIMSITFTNKAADEMRSRVKAILPRHIANKVYISTFHSLCARLLRTEYAAAGVDKNYTICDDGETKSYITQAIAVITETHPRTVRGWKDYKGISAAKRFISRMKQELKTPEDLYNEATDMGEEDVVQQHLRKVYEKYQRTLDRSHSVDFDDLLMKGVQLLEAREDIRNKYARRIQYLQVDEYQDTNYSQYKLVRLLSGFHNNITVVGDSDQCLIPDTEVETPNGSTPIENIEENHSVTCASGRNTTAKGATDRAFKRQYTGEVVTIETENGKKLTGTPGHCMFTRFDLKSGAYHTYLMYEKTKGYRVGRTGPTRSSGKHTGKKSLPGFIQRLNQERADAIWLIQSSDSINDASFWENYYAAEYGLPTCCFYTDGRNLAIGNKNVKRLFESIDTEKRAKKLLADKGMSIKHPHYRPQATTTKSGKTRNAATMTMFGSSRQKTNRTWKDPTLKKDPWYQHEFSICSSLQNTDYKIKVEQIIPTNPHKKGKYWQARKSLGSYDKIAAIAKRVELTTDAVIRRRARLTSDTFDYMPLAHVVPGMLVPTVENGTVTEDRIVNVSRSEYDGPVYDVSVPDYRNYIANGIVVHNSIYAFRGADITNITKLETDYEGNIDTYYLEENFRSTPQIAEAANQLIAHNPKRKEKDIKAVAANGAAVCCIETLDPKQEAAIILDEIKTNVTRGEVQYKDHAILYRTHARSRIFEDLCVAHNIPYQIIGGLGFYNRAAIKDVIAYLRLRLNHYDEAAFLRIYDKPPRGFGDKSYAKLNKLSEDLGISMVEVFKDRHYENVLKGRPLSGARKLRETFRLLYQQPTETVSPIVRTAMEASGYKKYLELEPSDDNIKRLDDMDELVAATDEFDKVQSAGLSRYIEWTSLMQSTDEDKSENRITLMTCHAAKGMEFKRVNLVGATEGIMPIIRETDDEGNMKTPKQLSSDIEEERRVFFVAVTRAEKRLTVTTNKTRYLYNQVIPCEPSRFIADMGEEVVHEEAEPTAGYHMVSALERKQKSKWGGKPRFTNNKRRKRRF